MAVRKSAAKKARKPIVIKHPGSLNKLVGGKACDPKNLPKVRKIAKTGTPAEKKKANLALNVFCPAAKKAKKGK